jgi:hypothetical protein
MKVAALVASRNRPDLVEQSVEQLSRSAVPVDTYVVECGTDPAKLSPHSSLWFADPDFRGKCFGHNLALEHALASGDYDYVFVLMNDLVFETDPLAPLLRAMESSPRLAVLSPTEVDSPYPAGAPRDGSTWRPVTTSDYLALLMRVEAIRDAGFLNRDFKYCWGAIHELSYKLYSRGWVLGYSDEVSYRHLGGTTYGAAGTNTISRDDYQREAKLFAARYMRETYGPEWDARFWTAAQGHGIEVNTYSLHRARWEEAEVEAEPIRLHVGSGTEYREGWLNVDLNPLTNPDIVSRAEDLPMLEDGSVDEIEACHLFEHFTYTEAVTALAEWFRVLRPGGELTLELPNLAACIEVLGKAPDKHGFDLGLIGIFGWPPGVDADGHFQVHKWGWTPETLGEAMRNAGFADVEQLPVTQTWRPAAAVNRDMRIRARKPAAVAAVPGNGEPREEVRVELDDDSRAIVICFSSISGWQQPSSPPQFEFEGVTRDIPAGRILVRDCDRAWYHSGTSGLGENVVETAESLIRICREAGAERVITTGASAGGYAALLFGALIGADEVHAISPQTFIDAELRAVHGDARWPEQVEAVYDRPGRIEDFFDLRPLYAEYPGRTAAFVHYAPENDLDTVHARHLAGLEGVELVEHARDEPIPADGHGLVWLLRNDGTLRSILAGAVARDLPAAA